MGISSIKITRSCERLIFIMGIPILVTWQFISRRPPENHLINHATIIHSFGDNDPLHPRLFYHLKSDCYVNVKFHQLPIDPRLPHFTGTLAIPVIYSICESLDRTLVLYTWSSFLSRRFWRNCITTDPHLQFFRGGGLTNLENILSVRLRPKR